MGKTTGVRDFVSRLEASGGIKPRYISCDGPIMPPAWLEGVWQEAVSDGVGLLVVDEVQKVEHWSEVVKKLWDAQQGFPKLMRLVLLGSSSLGIQRALSESLAGRYVLHRAWHWDFLESQKICNLSLEEYLRFGGYPGAYRFKDDANVFLSYLSDSIIEPVIEKDILKVKSIKSPALFRQSFDLFCTYGGQKISYNKLLVKLHDKGNVTLVQHYMDLFEKAFLFKQLYKFSPRVLSVRKSSPKLLPLCTVFYSIAYGCDLDQKKLGRAFEVFIGTQLVRLPGRLYYWREKNLEVDYVYTLGDKLYAFEIKFAEQKTSHTRGIVEFKKRFPQAEVRIINPQNYARVVKRLAKTP